MFFPDKQLTSIEINESSSTNKSSNTQKFDEEKSIFDIKDNDDDLISDQFEVLNTNQEINEEELIEEQSQTAVDIASIEALNEMASQFTDRTDLSEEEYYEIIGMNFLQKDFNSRYSQYTNQLASEGTVDDIYNSLKKFTGLGITREMIQADFDNYSGARTSLQAIINKDETTAKGIRDKEFVRQVNEASTFQETINAFERYYGNEQDTLDAFNEYININKNTISGIYEDVRLAKVDDEYVFQVKFSDYSSWEKEELTPDGYKNFEITDKNEFLPIPLQNLLANGKLDTQDNKDILRQDIDFNSCYKFWTGADFSFENILDYQDASYQYSLINMGITQTYNLEQSLENNTLYNATEVFKNIYGCDDDEAIEAFNNYYAQVLNKTPVEIPQDADEATKKAIEDYNKSLENIDAFYFESVLTGLRAEKNSDGDIVYVMRFEGYGGNKNYLKKNFNNYNGIDDYYEITYNPTENRNNSSDAIACAQDAFECLNSNVAQTKLIEKKFDIEYALSNGKTTQEVISEYQEKYEQAFGHSEIQDALSTYINDMDTYAQKLSSALTIGSIGLSFFCPAAGLAAMGFSYTDNIIDGVNMASNDLKGEDWRGLLNNTFKEMAFQLAGIGIGKFANYSNSVLTSKLLGETSLSANTCMTIGTTGEVVLDVGLGAAFDYITTGDINLSGNGLSGILDIISGIRGAKALSSGNYVKGADGTYTSYSKAAGTYTKYTPNPDGTYTAKFFDINDRKIELGSQQMVKSKNFFGSTFIPILSELTIQATKINKYATKHMDEAIDQVEKAFSGMGIITGRPKSTSSTLQKLVKKYNNGILLKDEGLLPYSKACFDAIGDAFGTRIQINNLSVEQSTGIIKTCLEGSDYTYEQFIKYISGDTSGFSEAAQASLKELEPVIITSLKEAQTQEVFNALIKTIQTNKDFYITELNNYGDGISSYFTKSQLEKIAEVYFNTTGQKLKIVTQIDESYYTGKNNPHFDPDAEGNPIVTTDHAIFMNKGATKDSGYASCQMNLTHIFDDNTTGNGEFQVRGTALNDFADVEHIPYDIRQDKITADDPKYSSIYSTIKSLSPESYAKYNNYLKETYNWLRLQELGINIPEPSLSGSFLTTKGIDISDRVKELLSRENLLKYATTTDKTTKGTDIFYRIKELLSKKNLLKFAPTTDKN